MSLGYNMFNLLDYLNAFEFLDKRAEDLDKKQKEWLGQRDKLWRHCNNLFY